MFWVCISGLGGAVKKAIPTSLQLPQLHHSHYLTLAIQPGERCMYDSMRREFHWQLFGNEIYKTVLVCQGCPQNKPSEKWWPPLQLFLAGDRLEFVIMDMVGRLPKTLSGSQLVQVMTNRYSKLRRAVVPSSTIASHIALLFTDSWKATYKIPEYV